MEDLKKLEVKTRKKQLKMEELGETWLRRQNSTNVCSAK